MMRPRARQLRRQIGCVALATLALAAYANQAAAAGSPRLEAPTLAGLGYGGAFTKTSKLSTTGRASLAASMWVGGRYTIGSGEAVTVYVSATYGASDDQAREWANWFASLPHGAELALLTAYLAPLGEVQSICGSGDVLGCYGGQRLVSLGDSSGGMPPASIAAHEYGHHVANNRSNAPWKAIDWGTKRWATSTHICSRVSAGTAFPGDEGFNYTLNPGEGFAESYRVLVETNGSAEGYDWPIVDATFRPDTQALAGVREDTLHPWVGATSTAIRGRFAKGRPTWSRTLATPLDGDLRVDVASAAGLTLRSVDGLQILARGAWNGTGGTSATYRICGARSLQVRLNRNSTAARFALRITIP
jgi:hypothetical protein